MIKKEIRSWVKNHLQRIDKVNSYHDRIIDASCEKVLNELYHFLYGKNPRLLDNYTKTYGVPTPITIIQEAGSTIYYSNLPVAIVNLPCKSSGVRHIYPAVQTGNVFVPMDAREADLMFNTDVAVVTNKIGFRVRQDSRVDYWNSNAPTRAAGVRMDLLIPFSVYLDTDIVNIPELGEDSGGSFMQRVLAILSAIPPNDLKDDNAPAERDERRTK